ncbi:MAG: hypothetical protein KF782_02470 [Labilithrix sp.]|nr:hypothetical protein [Labilithrix sp.]
MSDERQRERPRGAADSGVQEPPSSSRDLLDLVRSAEEDARLALRKRTPAIATTPAAIPSDASPPGGAVEEEFVDVGDEAVDAPPSMPPLRAATPAVAFASAGAAPARRAEDAPRGWSPLVGILLVLTLAVGALALVAR